MACVELLPRPASLSIKEGCVRLGAFSRLLADEKSARVLSERFPGLCAEEAQGFSLCLYADRIPEKLCVCDKPDAYALAVTADGVRIDAASAAGLFYGLQTLLQLPDECPLLHITDYAAIPIRMIHWDLKGYLPRFAVLKDELRRLAAFKVNAILLELEDKYAYRCAPDIAVEGAYTYEQLRELSLLAHELHIAIVPKLQSIAHVDYILKHEKYRHLRENGHVFQYCPVNAEAQRLWEAMCDELLDCFAEHGPYFHIGADEPGNLGECEECQKLGKAGSYLHKVSACIAYVRSKGRMPIMWDDIVRNHYGLFTPEEASKLRTELGRECVMMYWAYGYGGRGNEFPYIREYADAGLRVWGASGYAGCDNWAGSLPPLEIRALNLDAWAKAAVEENLECVCATGWTRIGSADCPAEPQETSWFTILYAAASMWNPDTPAIGDFVRTLSVQLYGCVPDEALTDAIVSISKKPYDCKAALQASDDEPALLQLLRAAAAAESLSSQRTRLLNYFQYYEGKLENRLEDYRLNLLNTYCSTLLADLDAMRGRLYCALTPYYEDVTVEEFLRTRLDYLEKLAGQLRARLDVTLPF